MPRSEDNRRFAEIRRIEKDLRARGADPRNFVPDAFGSPPRLSTRWIIHSPALLVGLVACVALIALAR